MTRLRWLAVVAVLVAGVLVWRWMDGWGLITVNFVEAPLGRVVAAVERQGGVKIVTNADLATPVTLQVRRAPVFDVLETLAVRLDGRMQLTYLIAENKRRVAEGVMGLASTPNPEGWTLFQAGWGGGMLAGETVPDLRKISMKPTPMEDPGLHAMLNQTSQKTGLAFGAPTDWNPPLKSPPKPGTAAKIAKQLARAAGGASSEVAVIFVRPQNTAGPQTDSGDSRGGRGPGGGGGGGDPSARGEARANPEWMAERVEAQIALLPKEEQEQARQDFTEMRQLWQGIRELPEEERRAKIEEIISRPDVQDRMEERRLQRDMRRSPEQRSSRYQRYVDRKNAAQKAGQ